MAIFRLHNICKSFSTHGDTQNILKNINMILNPGEVTALIGPSGSGKSTLLQIAGLLDSPDSGEIWLGEKRLDNLFAKDKTIVRRMHFGFIYQFHHLLNDFSVFENIAFPLKLQNQSNIEIKEKVLSCLAKLSIEHKVNSKPNELSGGEQQRVAIARAIIHSPHVLFADEPTGNLDPATSQKIFKLFIEMVKENNLSALIVTHNHGLSKLADNIINL